jgi:hypothetical protein
MWNSTLSKAIRWILYIPIIQIALGLLNLGLAYLTYQLFDFDWNFWRVLIFIFFLGSIVISLPMIISMIISALTVAVCPDRKIGGYIYSILAAINFAWLIYEIWTVDIDFSGRVITTLIIATIVILITAGHSIYTALMFSVDD